MVLVGSLSLVEGVLSLVDVMMLSCPRPKHVDY